MKSKFLLDPNITYLNHGSFGACPKEVFEDYQKWQLELEREPVQFLIHNQPKYLKKAKQALAKFINCDADDFFFTTNPTFAINIVMRGLNLSPGDEILATSQEYGAMDKTWSFYSKKSGIKYIRQNISLPVTSKQQMLEEFWSGYSSKTKVVFINQMSSATALLFPVDEICQKARELGLITIIDGAHIPGHFELDIKKLQPDFYTGTLHKWMSAPKGSSFLYVDKKFHHTVEPLVVSWGYDTDSAVESVFLDNQELQGTREISAFLAAPAAIRFLEENDWNSNAIRCRQLIQANYKRFCDLLNAEPLCPISEEFLGQMCSIPIRTSGPKELKRILFEKYKIEIPVMNNGDSYYLRISMQFYNDQQDLDILYSALHDIIATTQLLAIENT